MAIEINMNAIHPGRFAPPVPAQPAAAQKQKAQMTADDARELLNLVNIGSQVLDLVSFNKPPQAMIFIAESIKSASKNDMGVKFENGRIHVPKDLFESIVRAYEQGPDRNVSIIDGIKPQITYTSQNTL